MASATGGLYQVSRAVREVLIVKGASRRSIHQTGFTGAGKILLKPIPVTARERAAAVDGFVAQFLVAAFVAVDLAQPGDQ
jgi:hypothetical protein